MNIKKIVTVALLALSCFVSTNESFAASVNVVSLKEASLFKIKTAGINKIANTPNTRFDFVVSDIATPNTIGYWKLRVWCEKGVKVLLDSISGDRCGEAIDMRSIPQNMFSLSMNNNTGKTLSFSFKLKAYDVNGKWLHSERAGFHWK
jgi:hypothetical protein